METKDIIMIAIAIVGLFLALWQYIKNQKLQKKMFQYQRERDKKGDLEEEKKVLGKVRKKRTDEEIYCDHIDLKFKFLDFTGLNAILQKPLLLENIYVKLRAKKFFRLTHYQTIADFKELDEEKTKEEDEDFVTVFEKLHTEYTRKREPMKLVILGQPGSGKTTLMKWIALQCACSREPIFAGFIPVFISLKDFARYPDKTFKAKNINDLTVDMLRSENISPSFIDEQFEDNRMLFLLDGLDEVADENLRKEVIQWIEKQNIRKNTLLVTSRFSGLQEAKGLKFHDVVPVFTVQDFDIADIERFLENWYKNIEVAVVGEKSKEDTEQAIKKGKTQYEDLMNIIKEKSYKNLRQLAVNPLLLTIIAIVHRTRAVLPKERHKLYEECLKVMIELWNVANKKLDISFSVENSMDNLSKIAVLLMKENRREVEISEIKTLLPPEIETYPLDFFLKEMLLKAGLLYESEGKYGFLHLTFQEYLAALYFASGDDQNAILEFRDKDYWIEIFKLFVNIGNPRQFFNEIIDYLEEKNYWQQMQLWDDCLRDIVVEETQKEIEKKFAKKILKILPNIEYKKENESFIIQLFTHYPLYQYADQFVDEGWNLFYHAKHPFVQSVGSSILNRAGDNYCAELMEQLKNRINDFEKQEDKNRDRLLDFVYQNDNTFVLLIGSRKNLVDFNFALAKLKSNDLFIVYLDLRYFLDLRYLLDFRNDLDPRYLLVLLNLLDLLDLLDLRDLLGLRYLRDLQEFRYLRYLRYLLETLDLRDQFIEKYESIFREHKKEIDAWVDKAIKKLHAMSDEELLTFFPGTTKEEIKIFKTNYPPFITKQLKKGKNSIFKELNITNELLTETGRLIDEEKGEGTFYEVLINICSDKSDKMREKRTPIIRYLMDQDQLKLDRPTVLCLLNFDLDLDNEENQALELEAFASLRKKDYARLRELVVGVVENPPDEATSLNAVYIFKYIN
jgi:DNA replication protein DnaC